MSKDIWKKAKEYMGVTEVLAVEMDRGEYNLFRGWTIPDCENPKDTGYIVKYVSGYISWYETKQFEASNRLLVGITFGAAILAMKKGLKVARTGWNGKGMFCIYVPGTKSVKLKDGSPYFKALCNDQECHEVEILPHFDMYTVNAEGTRAFLPGWLASQSDLDSADWYIVR